MPKAKGPANKLLMESHLIDARKGDDTIRIWESYRDQALMWRALSIIQIPVTFVALIMCLVLWSTRSIELNVPEKPKPGQYAVQQIPDVEFIEAATGFINLIATYQPVVARKQFEKAAEMVKEPLLERFRKEMLNDEVKAIESTARTQIYFVDPSKTEIKRVQGNQVSVRFAGSRLKMIAGKEMPLVNTAYTITMTTIPRNTLNQYGIMVTALNFENIESGES